MCHLFCLSSQHLLLLQSWFSHLLELYGKKVGYLNCSLLGFATFLIIVISVMELT